MEMVQQLHQRYKSYVTELDRVYAEAKPADGLFGWGDDPRKDPCHMRFYEDVEGWTKAFLTDNHDPSAVFEAVSFMLRVPSEYREHQGFWFMYAAQGLARDMIPMLTAQQCAELRDFYDTAYQKRDRMPVQKELYKLLKKGAARK